MDGVLLADDDAAWIDELIPIWRASFESGVGVTDPHSLDEQRACCLREVLPETTVRLALFGDQLVGFIAATHDSVRHLYIRIGFQRHKYLK